MQRIKIFMGTAKSPADIKANKWLEENPDYKPNKEVENLMNDVCVECMKLNFLEYVKE